MADDETPPKLQFWLTDRKWSSEYNLSDVYYDIQGKVGLSKPVIWSTGVGPRSTYWQSVPTVVMIEWNPPQISPIKWFIENLHGPLLFLAVRTFVLSKDFPPMKDVDMNGLALTKVKELVLPLLENRDEVNLSDLDYEILVIDFQDSLLGFGMQPRGVAKHYHLEAPEGEIVENFILPVRNWIQRFEDPSRLIKSANKTGPDASGFFKNMKNKIKKALVKNEGDPVKAAASLMRGEESL